MPSRKSGKRAVPDRPLLVIDGDSFAHRAYHGVPKTLRRAGGKSGGAIIGFANTLLKLYEAERPRAVVVGWDTLAAPNWRVLEFPAYQSGRDFDDELLEQLDVLPDFGRACGFVAGKERVTRPTTSSLPQSLPRNGAEGPHWWRAATAIPSSSHRPTPPSFTR